MWKRYPIWVAPLKYKFHGWLTLQKRCWTADRLEHRGLPNHGLCPLCARHNETSDHLVRQCPFSRDVWASLLLRQGLQHIMPTAQSELARWWPEATEAVPRSKRRELNSFILLTIRSLWLERNARVFDGKLSPVTVVCNVV
jgi:hypothetical protein